MRIEPGLASGATGVAPVKDYYAVFWKQPLIRDADRLAGATQEDIMWASTEQYLRDADDAHRSSRGPRRKDAAVRPCTRCTR